MDPTVTIAIITAGVSIVSLFVTRYLQRRVELEKELLERKIPIYSSLIDSAGPVLDAVRSGREVPRMKVTKEVFTWGSNHVVTAYLLFRANSLISDEPDYEELRELFVDLLVAIRKDLGYGDLEQTEIGKIGRELLAKIFTYDSLEAASLRREP